MEESGLRQIATLIKSGDVAQARKLLSVELRERPTADAWYLAAYVALSEKQKLDFVQKALEVDPFHEKANRWLEKYQERETRNSNLVLEKQGPNFAEAQLLERAVSIFNKHGWTMTLSTDTTRQFEKKQTINGLAALAVILLLNVVGLVIVVLAALGAQTDHVTLQTTGKGYLLGMEISQKRQHLLRSEDDIEYFAKWRKVKSERGPVHILWVALLALLLMLTLCLIITVIFVV